MSQTHDVVVVGGRVAGASTAMLLARRGHRVLLVDRADPRTDTLSTHALMRTGVLQLERRGLLDQVVDVPTPAVRRLALGFGDERIEFDLRDEYGVDALYAPRRHILDGLILDAAVAAGVEFSPRTRVVDVTRNDSGRVDGIEVETRRSTAGIAARFVVGADGMRSKIAQSVGATPYHHQQPTNSMVYGYFEGIEQTVGYDFQFTPGAGSGLIATNEGLTNVFVAFPKVDGGYDTEEAFFSTLESASPAMAEQVLAGRRVDRFRRTPGLPSFLRRPAGPGWALVGDAGFTKDPLSAHGISDALRGRRAGGEGRRRRPPQPIGGARADDRLPRREGPFRRSAVRRDDRPRTSRLDPRGGFDADAGARRHHRGGMPLPEQSRLPTGVGGVMRGFTVIIGAGQAGLAASSCLSRRGVPHVVLERGRIGQAWRDRWESLRLLTPNWMTRLPDHVYRGDDPDGYMSRDQLVGFFEEYAATIASDVREGVAVENVTRSGAGYQVRTDQGIVEADNVVVATGHAQRPMVPAPLASPLSPSIDQIHSSEYRSPAALADGGVLIVGAGASGLQLATEIRASGRRVILSAGRHARAVRRYRGMDLWWWLERIGTLDVTVDEVEDFDAARRRPSLGLTGADGGVDVDLASLHRHGVRVVGRVTRTCGARITLGSDLQHHTGKADRRLTSMLDRFDDHATRSGIDAELGSPTRPVPVELPIPPSRLDLVAEGIKTVVWATGYRRRYDWLEVDVLDEDGEIRQRRGVTPSPGLFVLGLRHQWSRRSHFIDGVGADADYVAGVISANRDLAVA